MFKTVTYIRIMLSLTVFGINYDNFRLQLYK